MSFLRKMFSGKVHTGEPRRFLIEAMLGAMEADGEVAAQEMEVLQKNLEEHELFRDLTGDETSRLIDLAADAIRDAGGGGKRIPAIAKGLASRAHRLAAYTMACEVCVSDDQLHESEISFLTHLQSELNISDEDARELFESARSNSGLLTLEEKTERIRDLIPHFVDCMALMAAADGEVHFEELVGIRAVLRNIPDMTVLTSDELDEAIEISIGKVKDADPAVEIAKIAEQIVNPADRFWTAVYMLIIILADGKTDWREVAFLKVAATTFGLNEAQMDQALECARLFPATELGGAAPE